MTKCYFIKRHHDTMKVKKLLADFFGEYEEINRSLFIAAGPCWSIPLVYHLGDQTFVIQAQVDERIELKIHLIADIYKTYNGSYRAWQTALD